MFLCRVRVKFEIWSINRAAPSEACKIIETFAPLDTGCRKNTLQCSLWQHLHKWL